LLRGRLALGANLFIEAAEGESLQVCCVNLVDAVVEFAHALTLGRLASLIEQLLEKRFVPITNISVFRKGCLHGGQLVIELAHALLVSDLQLSLDLLENSVDQGDFFNGLSRLAVVPV